MEQLTLQPIKHIEGEIPYYHMKRDDGEKGTGIDDCWITSEPHIKHVNPPEPIEPIELIDADYDNI